MSGKTPGSGTDSNVENNEAGLRLEQPRSRWIASRSGSTCLFFYKTVGHKRNASSQLAGGAHFKNFL